MTAFHSALSPRAPASRLPTSTDELDAELDAILADPLSPRPSLRASPIRPAAHGARPQPLPFSRSRPVPTTGAIEHGDQAARLRSMVSDLVVAPEDHSKDQESGPTRFAPDALVSLGDHQHDRLPLPARARSRATVIAVASGKGGVGKTNLAVNLSIALSQRQFRTFLVDADLGTANADILCGLSPHARLDHVLTEMPVHDAGRRTLQQIAVAAPGGFSLVPGSAGLAHMADMSPGRQNDLVLELGELEDDSDVIVIDTAAGIARSVLAFLAAADEAVIVTTPEPTAIADAYALIKCLHYHLGQRAVLGGRAGWPLGRNGECDRLPRVHLVINQAISEQEARGVYARLAAVCSKFLAVSVCYGGHIAHDLRVGEAVRARSPLLLHAPSCAASRNIRDIAASLSRGLAVTRPSSGSHAPQARASLIDRWLRLASGT